MLVRKRKRLHEFTRSYHTYLKSSLPKMVALEKQGYGYAGLQRRGDVEAVLRVQTDGQRRVGDE